MIIIGERINGMYNEVAKAIADKKSEAIGELARAQVKAGANILDVSVGPYSKNPKEDMLWLVNSIQKAVNVSLAIDSPNPDVIGQALQITSARPVINSTSADTEKMEAIFALAKKHNAQVIGLAMDKSGVPSTKDSRLELAAKIIEKAAECGISMEDLYIDPIAMPVNVAQAQGVQVIESIREIAMLANPPVKTVIGLSNVSQGANRQYRSLFNRTFLVMAQANGLTCAILDPLDNELMEAMIAAEVLANKIIYCDSFLDAYKKK